MIFEGLLLIFFSITMKKVSSFYKYTHIKVREQKPYLIYDQNRRNQLNLIPYL